MDKLTKIYRDYFVANKPIFIDNLGYVYTPTLIEILEFSSDRYFAVANQFCVTKYSFENYEDYPDDFSAFMYITQIALTDTSARKDIIDFLGLLTKGEVIFIEEYGVFVVRDNTGSEYILKEESFSILQNIIRLQNNIPTPPVKKDRSKMVREIDAKMAKGRRMLEEKQGKTFDLVQQVFNLSIAFNSFDAVQKLNIFCFTNLYKKFIAKEEYTEIRQLLLAGASGDDISPKEHWANRGGM